MKEKLKIIPYGKTNDIFVLFNHTKGEKKWQTIHGAPPCKDLKSLLENIEFKGCVISIIDFIDKDSEFFWFLAYKSDYMSDDEKFWWSSNFSDDAEKIFFDAIETKKLADVAVGYNIDENLPEVCVLINEETNVVVHNVSSEKFVTDVVNLQDQGFSVSSIQLFNGSYFIHCTNGTIKTSIVDEITIQRLEIMGNIQNMCTFSLGYIVIRKSTLLAHEGAKVEDIRNISFFLHDTNDDADCIGDVKVDLEKQHRNLTREVDLFLKTQSNLTKQTFC